MLNKIKKEQAEAKLLFGPEYNDNNLIFCKEDGSPYDPDVITKAFKRYAKKAGFENVTFHSLRHSFASILLENGVDLSLIKEFLGHTNISTTSDIYAHVSQKMKQEAVEQIDDVL